MSYLIFCSFEVGGLPYKMAELLNSRNIETYYISIARKISGHDSTAFHHSGKPAQWDLSSLFFSRFLTPSGIINTLKKIKNKYNVLGCLATGNLSYYLKYAGINYKYWSYGSDLDQVYSRRVFPSHYSIWKTILRYPYLKIVAPLTIKKTIISSDAVMISPYQINALKKIDTNKNIFCVPHFAKILDFNCLSKLKIENKNKICNKIDAKQYFFSSVRHVWKGINQELADNKGNDIILKSFSRYIKSSGDSDTRLLLINKGFDVEYSKLLSRQLGIEKFVIWLDEMRREELFQYYQGAALCFGQFGTPIITNTVIESLSSASVCISFFNMDSSYVCYKEQPPVFNSKDDEEIANFIIRITRDANSYKDLSYKSWLWAAQNCSEEKFIESFVNIFNDKDNFFN